LQATIRHPERLEGVEGSHNTRSLHYTRFTHFGRDDTITSIYFSQTIVFYPTMFVFPTMMARYLHFGVRFPLIALLMAHWDHNVPQDNLLPRYHSVGNFRIETITPKQSVHNI